MKLDAIDVKILRALQDNARLSNVQLASEVGLSPSPCLVRVRALEESGLIGKYVALLDPGRLGLKMSVFIQISLGNQTENALEIFQSAINDYPEVMECYLMTGDADYLLRVVVADVDALRDFILNKLSTIEGIANIRSSVAISQVKYVTALPIEPDDFAG